MASEQRVEHGTIAASNDKGVKLVGFDAWLNYSKWGERPVEPPAKGASVAVILDKAGFIRKIEPNGHTSTVTAPAEPEPPGQPTAVEQVISAANRPDRETVIARLAVMNTATSILSSGGRVASADDVLTLAARLECWANRPMEATA